MRHRAQIAHHTKGRLRIRVPSAKGDPAALEAIAQRGDAALEEKIVVSLFDANVNVRFTAAAAIIRLSSWGRRDTHRDTDILTLVGKDTGNVDAAPPVSH